MKNTLKKIFIAFVVFFIPKKTLRGKIRVHLRRKLGIVKIFHVLPRIGNCDKFAQGGGNAFVAYLPECYGHEKCTDYMLWHQNRREQLVIGRILQNMGFTVKVGLWEAPECVDNLSYDLVFGMGVAYEEVCRRNPSALKIYYGTGAFPKFHNDEVAKRAEDFNRRHKTNIVPERSISAESPDVAEYSDYIFQIGTEFTKNTYPKALHSKIRLINQSSNFIGRCDFALKSTVASQRKFLWLGSGGTILKGLDLLVDYFSEHREIELFVVGGLDYDFKNLYGPILKDCENIHCFGFLNTNSKQFRDILYHCGFLIFPSCTEGGCPGSVITAMRMGCIPIVSRPAAFEEISRYGFLLDEISTTSIEYAVRQSTSLDSEKFVEYMKKNIEYSENRWNLERFEEEMTKVFSDAIHGFYRIN